MLQSQGNSWLGVQAPHVGEGMGDHQNLHQNSSLSICLSRVSLSNTYVNDTINVYLYKNLHMQNVKLQYNYFWYF